jgi:microcystin-dependent protein
MAFDKLVAFQDWVSNAISAAVALLRISPPGAVMPYAGSSAPSGWLLCDGAAVSRTTYAALFTAIGTTYGAGDGSTTFNLPDLGGRVPAGKEATATRLTAGVSGVDGATLGAVGGDQRLHQHNHTASDAGHSHGVSDPGHFHSFLHGGTTPAAFTGRSGDGDGSNNYFQNTDTKGTGISIGTGFASITVANNGSGASQNVQPTIVLNYIIAT